MSRSRRPLLSALFLGLSVALFVAGGYLYLQDRDKEESRPPPAASPGKNELIHVTTALDDQGIDVDTLPGGVRSRMLEEPGQALSLDGVDAYVFIYADPALRDAVTLDVLPEDIDLLPSDGTPVSTAGLTLVQGSNVALVLVGSDDDLAAKAQAALDTLL